jgi:hypothetical protein
MAKIAHENHDHASTREARLACRRAHHKMAIEQIEFFLPDGDAPAAYYDSDPRQNWLLVVGICNVVFQPEEKQQVIDTLRDAADMLERN